MLQSLAWLYLPLRATQSGFLRCDGDCLARGDYNAPFALIFALRDAISFYLDNQ